MSFVAADPAQMRIAHIKTIRTRDALAQLVALFLYLNIVRVLRLMIKWRGNGASVVRAFIATAVRLFEAR